MEIYTQKGTDLERWEGMGEGDRGRKKEKDTAAQHYRNINLHCF